MPRKKKDRKVMVIGSMVVSVDADADIGAGDNYEITKITGKPWLPKMRKEIDVETVVEMEGGGINPDGTPMTKTIKKKQPLTQCQSYQWFVWDIFEDTDGSQVSSYINFWIMLLIVCSAIVAVVETIPSIHKPPKNMAGMDIWWWLESWFVVWFSIEFVCRAVSCPDKWMFLSTVMNYVDAVAIAPYYLDLILSATSGGAEPPNFGFLRILRLSRAARLIKLSKYSQGIRLVTNAMANSVDALQLFALLLTLVLVVFSSGIYYTERGDWVDCDDNPVCPSDWTAQFGPSGTISQSNTSCICDRYYRKNTLVGGTDKIEQYPSPFQSIPQSFWWCIVTLTTVGYGDMYPYTTEGKIVGVLTMLVGLIMLALPLSIIGTNFIEERNTMVQENERRQEEEEKAKVGMEPAQEDEKPKHKMRADLREVLAKADQLYDSTGQMSEQLARCAELLREMRRFKVSGGQLQATAAGDGQSDTGAPTADSAAGSGEGSGAGESAVAMEMPTVAPVFAVPVPVMEELKGVCLAVLQRAIEEMKIWDPQGELPEMPAQIMELLSDQNATAPPPSSQLWKERLAAYESVAMPSDGRGPSETAAANCSEERICSAPAGSEETA